MLILHMTKILPRYSQHSSNLMLISWFDTLEFNRLLRSNNKMYDDAVFADRFRYELAMFWIRVLTGLSRHLHAHVGCEIDTAKIIAAFCLISYCLHDFIRLNSIVCHDQRARCTLMSFSMIDSVINWFMSEVCILIGLFRLLDTDIAYEMAI